MMDLAAFEVSEFNLWNKHPNDTAYVFADKAYIRSLPSASGKIIDSLTHGSAVYIKSKAYNPTTIRGFEAPWQKIIYQQNNQIREGFIWLGLLDLSSNKDKIGNNFIYGFLRYDNPEKHQNSGYTLQIKGFDKDKNLIAKCDYKLELNGQSYTDSKLLSNMGLENLDNIYRIGFLGEACGVATTHYYFSWNGKSMDYLFNKSSVSDAGIFYYEETILFPSEHKLADNLIIKDIEQGEVIDEMADELKYKTKRKREKYSWDGFKINKN